MTNLNLLYLAHDLSDPAVARRLDMLKSGNASITLAGFRRTDSKITGLRDCPAIDLGQTRNAAFSQRIKSVLRTILTLHRHRAAFAGTNLIIARNLEMLAIAMRAQKLITPQPVVVYEILDIHRLLLKNNIAGSIMRALESWCVRRCAAIVTSSPAFIRNYFHPRFGESLPIRLVENKIMNLDNTLPSHPPTPRPPGPPWLIGWFGIIRCRRSLLALREIVTRYQGSIQVIIRGRPALDAIKDFHDIIESNPNLHFYGPYNNPKDLEAIYCEVHFVWAIDMYEEGLNSAWLLPNRLYEGGYYGAVPFAVDGVETSNFLRSLYIGISLKQPFHENLAEAFATLTPKSYQNLAEQIAHVPPSVWVYDQSDCLAFTDWLQTLTRASRQ